MKIRMIPLTALVPSPANVRKTGTTNGIAELAASIEAHGLLQNLQVRKANSGKFEVVAGSRRHAALKLLAKRKALAKDAPIACNVLDDEDAAEISLAENEMRQAMHPADQFEAWKALIDAGQGIEDVAARFGVAPTVVRQRLKLAAVSPKLMALYRKGEMKLDQLMAFTVSDDHAVQEAAWFDRPDWQRSAQTIRQTLTAAHVRADDRRARFVTVEAYIGVGGSVITDLFQSKSGSYLTDPALLDRLANEKLEREAEAVRQEGWKWVEIMPDLADLNTADDFGEVKGKTQPLPPKQAKVLAKAEREADKLRERDELDDDEAERLDALDAEIETLSERTYIWSDRQKARAGAILTVTRDGKLGVMRGLIHPEDMKAEKSTDDDKASDETGQPPRPCFSAALTDDLTAHRTAALRAMLADRPTVALAAAAHALALPVFYMGEDSGFALHAVSPALRAEGIEDSPAVKSLADQHAAWQSRLPDDEAALWDWLLAQDGGIVTGLLAYCVACTVKPVRDPRADQLATALSLDMAQWWQLTVAGYLGRVSKTLICEAVTEATGTVSSGFDGVAEYSGSSLFGFAPGTNLTGFPYTAVYTLDTTAGVLDGNQTACDNGRMASGLSTPVPKAEITISGKTYTLGASTPSSVSSFVLAGNATSPQTALTFDFYDTVTYPSGVQGPEYLRSDIALYSLYKCRNWADAFSYTLQSSLDFAYSSGGFQVTRPSTASSSGYQQVYAYFDVNTVAVSGPITPPSTPHIFFLNTSTGEFSDITNRSVQVVAGQQIQLFAIPADTPATPQAWTVPGNTVGAYLLTPQPTPPTGAVPPCAEITNPTPGCAETAPPDFTQQSTVFYWTAPGTFPITYNSASGSPNATFVVAGPTSVKVVTDVSGPADIYIPQGATYYSVEFGPYVTKSEAGIITSATADQPMTGAFHWVQVISADSKVAQKPDGSTISCSPGIGLDNWFYAYPTGTATTVPGYIENNYTYDSPNAGLDAAWDSLTRTVVASTFLMWQPNLPNSIPVPLGYAGWQLTFGALQYMPTGVWTPFGSGKAVSFKATPTYPIWNSVVVNGNCD